MGPVLELRGITKSYPGVVALKGVDFSLASGEVHALVGENGSGKSTMIKIISGVIHPDDGTMLLAGSPVRFASPAQAREAGIATVHQELAIVPGFDAASNVFLGREPTVSSLLVDWQALYESTARVLAELEIDIPPTRLVDGLNLAQKQLIEIARAVSQNARVLLLDEPTAALPRKDVQRLFEIIRRCKERGVAVLYVSHRLEEVQEIADRVTVLRDGQVAGSLTARQATIEEIIRLMVGREIRELARERRPADEPAGAALEVKDLTKAGAFQGVTFSVKPGEIVGIAGLVGCGRSELAACLAGAAKPDRGEILINGVPLHDYNPSTAQQSGIGFVPADRRKDGLATLLSVAENITASSLGRLQGFLGTINPRKLLDEAAGFVKNLSIKAQPSQKVETLSGGNQQKVVLAKSLCHGSTVLVCDEPTRGVDVATRREIYSLLESLSKQGKSAVVSSSDLDELLAVCDRILVMRHGEIVSEFNVATSSKSEVLASVLGKGEEPSGRGAEEAAQRPGYRTPLFSLVTGVPALLGLLVIYFSLTAPGFASASNIDSLCRQISILLLTATAQTYALVTGGIDLSINGVIPLASMALGIGAQLTGSVAFGLLAALAVGLAIGSTNGYLVARWNVEPFIVTLGTMSIGRGLALLSRGGEPISGLPPWFGGLAYGSALGVPAPLLAVLPVTIASWIFLSRAKLGWHLQAVGSNESAARLCGVNAFLCKFLGYFVAGLLSAFAAIILSARLMSCQPIIGSGAYLEALAAAILGGVSVAGGRVNPIRLVSGVLLVGILSNGLNIARVGAYPQLVIMGTVLVAALVMDRIRRAEQARLSA